MIIQESFFHVFGMQIGMNEFHHRILAFEIHFALVQLSHINSYGLVCQQTSC